MAISTPKFESLLKVMATRPMNYTEIKNWFASRSAGYQSVNETGLYDFSLYGTDTREGILPRFCRKNNDGRWQTVRKVEAPYTPVVTGW